MKTKIYKSKKEFNEREDKTENGVSVRFSKIHADFENQNKTNEGCFDCSNCSFCSDCSGCSNCSVCSVCSGCSVCSDCSGCSDCSDCSDCSVCSVCSGCSGCCGCSDCSDCSGCSNCSGCSDCSVCSGCSGCSGCSDKKESLSNFKPPIVPKIENIHAKVFDAASRPGAFNMSDWHTCETTHCRAGWVVHLAGEAGKNLEKFHNTALAAQLIYKESGSPINPCRFFDSSEDALADMKKCAEREAEEKT